MPRKIWAKDKIGNYTLIHIYIKCAYVCLCVCVYILNHKKRDKYKKICFIHW